LITPFAAMIFAIVLPAAAAIFDFASRLSILLISCRWLVADRPFQLPPSHADFTASFIFD